MRRQASWFPQPRRSGAEELYSRRIETVSGSRCREGVVGGDPYGPFCQGRGKVKAIVDCLIEVEGDRLGDRHIARRGQQLDRGCLDCRQGSAGRSRLRTPRYAFAHKTLAHSTINRSGAASGSSGSSAPAASDPSSFDHPFQRDAGIDNDRHAESRPRSRRRSSKVEGPSSLPTMRRISASRRAAASRSRPTAFVRARRACSSIEVPQAAARRRNASITVASKFADHNLAITLNTSIAISM